MLDDQKHVCKKGVEITDIKQCQFQQEINRANCKEEIKLKNAPDCLVLTSTHWILF